MKIFSSIPDTSAELIKGGTPSLEFTGKRIGFPAQAGWAPFARDSFGKDFHPEGIIEPRAFEKPNPEPIVD